MDLSSVRCFVSQSDFAKLRMVSRKAVTTWKQKGFLVMWNGELVDVTASVAKLDAAQSSPVKCVTTRPGNTGGNAAEVTRLQAKIRRARAILSPDENATEA